MRLGLRFLLVTAILIGPLSAQAAEFRGIFADAFHPGYRNHQEVVQLVTAAKAANLNALFVQVRARGDVYYDSAIEPKTADIAADYDALKDVIREGHDAGLKVYAWVTTYRIAKSPYDRLTHEYARANHPEWLMSDINGETVIGDEMFLDPGVPAVQDHIASIAREIATKYDVDGVHLDAVGYPSHQCGYNSTSIELYNRSVGKSGIPNGLDTPWCNWRAGEITKLVKRISSEVAAARPGATVSASVLSYEPMVARMTWLQEWDKWTCLDFIVPLVYSKEDSIERESANAISKFKGRHTYIGIGAWQISTETARSQIESCRQAGSQGVVLHYYQSLHPDPGRAVLTELAAQVFAVPASQPDMPWRKPSSR